MTMINKINMSLIAVGVIALVGTPAKAQSDAKAPSEPGAIGLGGETLFVLKAPMDLNKTLERRSNDVYDRIRFVLNNAKLSGKDIQVKPLEDYGYKIVANGQLIVPIGQQEAEAHGVTAMALANDWATHLRKVLPKLTARPDLFTMRYKNKTRRPARHR